MNAERQTVKVIVIGSSSMIHADANGKPACGRTSKRHSPAIGSMTPETFASYADKCALCYGRDDRNDR